MFMARSATRKAARKPARKTAKKSTGRRNAGTSRKASTKASKARKSPARKQPVQEKDLGDLFHETLKDILHAERQILRALPKMAKGANSAELSQAFIQHRDETQGHVQRLEQVFEMFGKRAQTKPCHAILGLVEESEEVMGDFGGSEALDAGLLAAAQAVEHYEISRYGTLRAWAEQLGMNGAADLLAQTLEEEKRTDALLTQLAESAVNQSAE
jgi:ferritin-like metal-binding protein YciE